MAGSAIPTVFREAAWVASFYSNENNEPRHIHLRKGGGEFKFWIGPVRLVWVHRLNPTQVRVAWALVEEHEAEIERFWNEYFD